MYIRIGIALELATRRAACVAACDQLQGVVELLLYAPDVNPVERVWLHLKRSLANLTKHTITSLTALAKTRLRRMHYRPTLLAGFLASTGLDLSSA